MDQSGGVPMGCTRVVCHRHEGPGHAQGPLPDRLEPLLGGRRGGHEGQRRDGADPAQTVSKHAFEIISIGQGGSEPPAWQVRNLFASGTMRGWLRDGQPLRGPHD